MNSTDTIQVESSEDELLDVPSDGPDDEPKTDAGAAGKIPGGIPSGRTESLIPEIFPVYPFI
ncbi:hypothetical protein [Arthrobacter globiformis]|uniref:hypothetical protein n=1 Tax=Arthrobacter globiformis TaxID=1665 RepID=UPI0027921FEC|nr:hypothetical protein [Arthrobacter globiformis]MDQ0618493.1 hypothetical protein [Arthrobacter globiformis]